tara:strand:- start:1865 stop:2965 length:1101 start_codon:yes stop_codon:yes gene_type:complete
MLKQILVLIKISTGFCNINSINWRLNTYYPDLSLTTSDGILFKNVGSYHNVYVKKGNCDDVTDISTPDMIISDDLGAETSSQKMLDIDGPEFGSFFIPIPFIPIPPHNQYCIYCLPHYYLSPPMKFTLSLTEPPGGSGDPHLVLANGQTTDFRGVNNTYFNFITSPGFGFNIKTNDADFMLKKVLVHGSFMTEAHIFTEEAKVSLFGEKIGKTNLVFVNGTCGLERFKLGPHRLLECKTTRIKTEYSSFVVSSFDWELSLRLNFVYNRLKGPFKRIDFEVKKLSNVESHGIIGQSYYLNKDVKGEIDAYPLEGEFTTYSMANGVIDGSYKDYIVSSPYDYKFKYSKYINNSFTKRKTYNTTEIYSN